MVPQQTEEGDDGGVMLGATSEGGLGEDGGLGSGGAGRGRGVSDMKDSSSLEFTSKGGIGLGSLKWNRLINLHRKDE